MLDIKERIKKIIQEKLNFGDIEISNDEHLKETLSIDSIDFLTLVISVEKEFGVSINDDEVSPENFFSIETLTKYIKRKVQ